MTTTAQRRTKSDDIAERLTRDIQTGMFAPGAWLKQIDLEARYGATRIDVRRALEQLVVNRIVQHVPNRGYHVHASDPGRTAEQRAVRVILETAAAELMIQRVTPKDLADLTALADRFSDLVRDGTLLEQYEANISFHLRMLKLCPNQELARLVVEVRARCSSAPITQWKTHARIEQSARDHYGLIEALAAGDTARLRHLVAAHILQNEPAEAHSAEPAPRVNRRRRNL